MTLLSLEIQSTEIKDGKSIIYLRGEKSDFILTKHTFKRYVKKTNKVMEYNKEEVKGQNKKILEAMEHILLSVGYNGVEVEAVL